MFQRTPDLHYPSPAELNRWGRSVDRAAAIHSNLLMGLRFGAASPPSSAVVPAASPARQRFQLIPQPRFTAPPMPRPESVLGRLNGGGSFLPDISSPFDPQLNLPDDAADAGPDDLAAGNAGDYASADPFAGVLPGAIDNHDLQAAWPGAGNPPSTPAEPAWPDLPVNVGQSAATSAAGAAQRAGSAGAGTPPAAGTLAGMAAGGLFGAGVLPQSPKVSVSHANIVKLKQEAVRAIANEFSQRNLQQFNDLKRSMNYFEASLRATFR